MAAQDAATELVGLWPRLPHMVGPDWPQVRPQVLDLAGLIRAADTDEERVTHTESVLELLLPYPAVADVLGPAYVRGRKSTGSVTHTPDWADLCRLLNAMEHEQWIKAAFGVDALEGASTGRTRRLVLGIDRAAHPYAFDSAQLGLTVPASEQAGVLTVDLYGAPETVDIVPVHRSLVVRRLMPDPAIAPSQALFDVTLLTDRTVHLVAVFSTADGRTPQQLRLTVDQSGLLRQEVLLGPWRTPPVIAAPPADLSITLTSTGGSTVLTVRDGTGSATAQLPYSHDQLDSLVQEARKGIGDLLLGPNGKLYESRLDIPPEVYEFGLRRLTQSGFDLFHALFRPDDGSPQLRRVGDIIIGTLASAGPDSAPTVEVVSDGLNLPWHLMYAVDGYDAERLSPYRLLGLGTRITLVPLRSAHHHRHRTEYVPQTSSEATALIAVNMDIDRTLTGDPRALAAGQVAYWRQRLADRADVVIDAETVTEALCRPKRPDALWYFYCHFHSGPERSAVGDGALEFTGGRQVGLRDARREARTDVPLPGAPLVVLNACATAPHGSALRTGFPSYFLSRGARAVVSTDIEVPTELGAEWARRFFDRLLTGDTVATALHLTARELHKDHQNLLCLLYTAFGTSESRLVSPR